ncbi:MAG: hypothetical protein GY822_29560 [Deltaproteobacteria bacterium]|nr:hypothetical protein [Deltaproteobacteria bacterium]
MASNYWNFLAAFAAEEEHTYECKEAHPWGRYRFRLCAGAIVIVDTSVVSRIFVGRFWLSSTSELNGAKDGQLRVGEDCLRPGCSSSLSLHFLMFYAGIGHISSISDPGFQIFRFTSGKPAGARSSRHLFFYEKGHKLSVDDDE